METGSLQRVVEVGVLQAARHGDGAQRRAAARPFPAARHGQKPAACGGGGRPPGVAPWRRGPVARGGGRRPAGGRGSEVAERL
jgi:hypothetical protein